MNREGLHRIIRAAAAMLGEDTVVIIGSQSILASFREFMLPDDATMSAEADILPFDDDDEVKADKGRRPARRGQPLLREIRHLRGWGVAVDRQLARRLG